MEKLEKAKELYLAKKYKESLAHFKSLASSSPEASYYLGMHYYLGLATKQNYDKAFSMFKQSWEGLYHEGIYMLAKMHEEGLGTKKNIDQAFKLYQAANQSSQALTRLAQMYENGIGTDKDLVKALKLYNQLQKLGSPYAMYKIGRFYLSGQGLRKDLSSGYEWLQKALEKNHILAINYFRMIASKASTDIRSIDEIIDQAKSAMAKKDAEASLSFLELAIHEKSIEALLMLVDAYVKGDLFEKNPEKAFALLLKHQDLKDREIYYQIGYFYENGIGIISSYYKAALFYQKAAYLDHRQAKNALRELRGY